MKGIVLAGGTGSRLMPLTKIQNKHLLNVYNKRLIEYPINTLLQAGLKEILIVTGSEWAGDFMKLLGSGEDYGCRFYYTIQDRAGGIAEALGLANEFIGNDNMIVILGDNITDAKINIEDFENGARVYLKWTKDSQRFGVPKIVDNKIVKILEKPKNPPSEFAVTGIYMYDNSVFDIIKTLKPSGRGELEITDLNNVYIKKGQLDYKILKGVWFDAGTIDALHEAGNIVKQINL